MPEGKSPSPWEQVKNQTEQMINEKLDAAVFKDMESKILGIGDNVKMWNNKIDMKVGKNDISQVSAGCQPRVSAGKAWNGGLLFVGHGWAMGGPFFRAVIITACACQT